MGTDVLQLPELLTQQNSGVGEPQKAMVIMTRSAVRKQKEQKAEEKQLGTTEDHGNNDKSCSMETEGTES